MTLPVDPLTLTKSHSLNLKTVIIVLNRLICEAVTHT